MLTFYAIRRFCTPALIYLTLAVIMLLVNAMKRNADGILFRADTMINEALIPLIVGVFWAWVLNLICRAGQSTLSWALVIAPFVVQLLLMNSSRVVASNK